MYLRNMVYNRRTVIKSIGAAGLTGLAGCSSGGTTGSADDGLSVTIGLQAAFSGAYATAGGYVRKGVENGIQQAIEEGHVTDNQVELLTANSEIDGQVATSNAREFINSGATLLTGNMTSQVMQSAARVGGQEGAVTFGMGSSFETETGSCYQNLFKTAWTIPQHAAGSAGYALRNDLGSNVHDITSDFGWGRSMSSYVSQLVDELGNEVTGNPAVPVGTSEYAQYIDEAQNSNADILQLNLYGSDAISATNQAFELGALDEMKVMIPAMTPGMMGAVSNDALNHKNLYYNVSWLPFEKQAAQDFYEYYQNNYSDVPTVCPQETTWFHTSTYTYLKAASEAGSTDAETMWEQLDGRSLEPAIWPYDTRWRTGDHMLMSPAIVMQGVNDNGFFGPDQVVTTITEPERLAFPPEETACNFS